MSLTQACEPEKVRNFWWVLDRRSWTRTRISRDRLWFGREKVYELTCPPSPCSKGRRLERLSSPWSTLAHSSFLPGVGDGRKAQDKQ